jgi:hypothetical protein
MTYHTYASTVLVRKSQSTCSPRCCLALSERTRTTGVETDLFLLSAHARPWSSTRFDSSWSVYATWDCITALQQLKSQAAAKKSLRHHLFLTEHNSAAWAAKTRAGDLPDLCVQKAQAAHVPSFHIGAELSVEECSGLHARLRKTEDDVTIGRLPYMAIFAADTFLSQLQPTNVDCVVWFDTPRLETNGRLAANVAAAQERVTKALRHSGVQAIIHLSSADSGELSDMALVEKLAVTSRWNTSLVSAEDGYKALLTSVRFDCCFGWFCGGPWYG